MENKLYKLKHIPTGLYFTPSRGHGNLSPKGKIYVNTIPRKEWGKLIRIKFYSENCSKYQKLIDYFNIKTDGKWTINEYFDTNLNDWEVIEL